MEYFNYKKNKEKPIFIPKFHFKEKEEKSGFINRNRISTINITSNSFYEQKENIKKLIKR